jgi:precorrin-3B synthase
MLAVADAAQGAAVLAQAASAGLHVHPADPAVGVVCCIGAAGCWQTDCDTLSRADALIADRPAHLPLGARVHVSGCDKFCASRARFDLTLVGHAGGGFTPWAGEPSDRTGEPR